MNACVGLLLRALCCHVARNLGFAAMQAAPELLPFEVEVIGELSERLKSQVRLPAGTVRWLG